MPGQRPPGCQLLFLKISNSGTFVQVLNAAEGQAPGDSNCYQEPGWEGPFWEGHSPSVPKDVPAESGTMGVKALRLD